VVGGHAARTRIGSATAALYTSRLHLRCTCDFEASWSQKLSCFRDGAGTRCAARDGWRLTDVLLCIEVTAAALGDSASLDTANKKREYQQASAPR